MSGEEILIRRAEPDDFAAIYEIYRCPKVVAGTLQLPYPSLERWKQRLADPTDGKRSRPLSGCVPPGLMSFTKGRQTRVGHGCTVLPWAMSSGCLPWPLDWGRSPVISPFTTCRHSSCFCQRRSFRALGGPVAIIGRFNE